MGLPTLSIEKFDINIGDYLMNSTTLSGSIKGDATLVRDEDNTPYLTGTIRAVLVDRDVEVDVAVIYDESIAYIPFWSIPKDTYVYVTGVLISKELPYKNGAICSSWFKVLKIEASPEFIRPPKKESSVVSNLRAAATLFSNERVLP